MKPKLTPQQKEVIKAMLDYTQEASDTYHKEILEMTDEELRSHCFDDGDWEEDDLCIKEYLKRGFKLPENDS